VKQKSIDHNNLRNSRAELSCHAATALRVERGQYGQSDAAAMMPFLGPEAQYHDIQNTSAKAAGLETREMVNGDGS
jgi:hypothetical protein